MSGSAAPTPTPTPTPTPSPTPAPASANAGSRPDWLPEKFWDPAKSEARFEDLAKGYATLEGARTKVREEVEAERLAKRPADAAAYEAKFEGVDPEVLKDNPLVVAVREVAFEQGLDQAGFESIGKKVIGAIQALVPNPQEELKKLGENAETRLAAVDHWLETNVSDAEERRTLGMVAASAAGVRVLERLITKAEGKPLDPPPPNGGTGATGGTGETGEFKFDGMTQADVHQLMGKPEYYSPRHRDPAVIKKVEAWFDAKLRAGK